MGHTGLVRPLQREKEYRINEAKLHTKKVRNLLPWVPSTHPYCVLSYLPNTKLHTRGGPYVSSDLKQVSRQMARHLQCSSAREEWREAATPEQYCMEGILNITRWEKHARPTAMEEQLKLWLSADSSFSIVHSSSVQNQLGELRSQGIKNVWGWTLATKTTATQKTSETTVHHNKAVKQLFRITQDPTIQRHNCSPKKRETLTMPWEGNTIS